MMGLKAFFASKPTGSDVRTLTHAINKLGEILERQEAHPMADLAETLATTQTQLTALKTQFGDLFSVVERRHRAALTRDQRARAAEVEPEEETADVVTEPYQQMDIMEPPRPQRPRRRQVRRR